MEIRERCDHENIRRTELATNIKRYINHAPILMEIFWCIDCDALLALEDDDPRIEQLKSEEL